VIFSQNFQTSTVLADYISASPNSGQWNAISSSGANATISAAANNLSFTRSGNAASFSRTTDFSPIPEAVIYKFTLNISGNTANTTTAGVLQVGSAFGTANSAESNTNTYARLGINLNSTAGEFTLRDVTNGTNSITLSGTQSISWVLNNSGASMTYTNPSSTLSTIDNDRASVWAGNTLLFDNVNVQTATQSIADLKFVFSTGVGTITFDDFEITAIPEPTTWVLIGLGTAFVLWRIRRRSIAG